MTTDERLIQALDDYMKECLLDGGTLEDILDRAEEILENKTDKWYDEAIIDITHKT